MDLGEVPTLAVAAFELAVVQSEEGEEEEEEEHFIGPRFVSGKNGKIYLKIPKKKNNNLISCFSAEYFILLTT